MRFRRFGVAALAMLPVLAATAMAQPAPAGSLDNLDFEQGEIGQPPPGWSGSTAELGAERPQAGAKDAVLHGEPKKPAYLFKRISAEPYRGKLIRFRAAVRTDAPSGAGVWLRIDGKEGPLFAGGTDDRPVRGDHWTWADITTDVPPESQYLVFGGILFAGEAAGSAAFDSASLEILPDDRPPETPQAKAYLDRALDILENGHIDKKTADWPRLRAGAAFRAAHAQTPADTYPAIRFVIAQLGEQHTFLLPASADMNAIAAGPNPVALEARPLGQHVAELRLPGIGDQAGPAVARYINTLWDAIAERRAAGACGWIVDLREDTGGNVHPMLTGLAPLLGPPPWAGYRDADGALSTYVLDGEFVRAVPVETWPAPAPPVQLAPLAVLIGPHTTSSGEMMALALAGRDNARSFGAPTNGRTTGNTLVPLSDGANLVLTVSYDLDRTGKAVHGPLLPDQPVPVDEAEEAALAWLAGKGCR